MGVGGKAVGATVGGGFVGVNTVTVDVGDTSVEGGMCVDADPQAVTKAAAVKAINRSASRRDIFLFIRFSPLCDFAPFDVGRVIDPVIHLIRAAFLKNNSFT